MAPLYRQAASKLTAAKAARGDDAARLRTEAQGLLAQAASAERQYLAPLMDRARSDAAYGVGVQYSLHQALRGETSGRWGAFDAAFSEASDNARGVEPSTLRLEASHERPELPRREQAAGTAARARLRGASGPSAG